MSLLNLDHGWLGIKGTVVKSIRALHWEEKEQVMGGYSPTKARLPAEAGSNTLAFMACKQGCGSVFFSSRFLFVFVGIRGVHGHSEARSWRFGIRGVSRLIDECCLRASLASVLQL